MFHSSVHILYMSMFNKVKVLVLKARERLRGNPSDIDSDGSKAGREELRDDNKQVPYTRENVEIWASTKIEEETFDFLWTLKGYKSLSRSEVINSPIFKGGNKSQHKWHLQMTLQKKSKGKDRNLSLWLYLDEFSGWGTTEVKARYRISLLDANSCPGENTTGGSTVRTFKRGYGWGCNKLITSADLQDPDSEDTIKIHCRIWIEGKVKEETGNGGGGAFANRISNLVEEDRMVRQEEQLSKEFGVLLLSSEFADVALATKTKKFMAHKAILAARSKVFGAMFSSKMSESLTNSVEITDFEADVVEAMLKFMYTGQIEGLQKKKASDLLQIAEKYDIPGLKEECEHSLGENLSVETATNTLLLAHLHNATLLKTKVIDFINRNKDDVRKTKAWREVTATNTSVFMELYLSVTTNDRPK